MAKALTQLEKFKAALPPVREIHLPLLPDTTVVGAVDVDTDIAGGSNVGWEVYGARWRLQVVADGEPIMMELGADLAVNMQLIRGEAPATPVILLPSNHNVIMDMGFVQQFDSAVGKELVGWREIAQPAVTQFGTLHLAFSTSADLAAVSAATNEIYMELFYRPVPGPKVALELL